MTNKAFLLGVNTSGLKYCNNDVKLMQECLEKHLFEVQIPQSSIKKDIVAHFERWVDDMHKTDTALFYYSGHGFAPRGSLQLVLNDNYEKVSSRLNVDNITDALEDSKASNKLIILDCCRANTVENTWMPKQSDFYRIITASERLEQGKEIDNLKSSFLTYNIHDLLFNKHHEVANENNEIRLNYLYEKLVDKTEIYNQSNSIKVPIPNLLGNQKADFVIAVVNSNNPGVKSQKGKRIRHNLPRQFYSKFVGRRASINRLLRFISPTYRQHITVIDGLGGVGKTALAVEVAYRCLSNSSNFYSLKIPVFDAIIFTSAKQNYLRPYGIIPRPMYETTLQDIFRTISIVLSDPKITQLAGKEQYSRVKQKLKEQSTLLIIDNLETLEINERKQVLSFINDLPYPTKVIITTRDQVLGYDASIRLKELTSGESIKLIKQQAKEKEEQITSNDAEQIYNRFGGIPAALIYIAGQMIGGYSLDALINISQPLPDDIGAFCFETSIRPLRGQIAYKLLMSVAIFWGFPLKDAVIAVAGVSKESDSVKHAFARLSQLSLIKKQNNSFSMMSMTREYVLQELDLDLEFKKQSRERLVAWYLNFAQTYGGKDWKNWRSNYDKLSKEWHNIESVLSWCVANKRYQDVSNLWKSLDNYVDISSYWSNRLHWWQWLIIESKRKGNLSNYVEAISEKGWTLTLMGGKDSFRAAKNLNKAWKLRKYANANPIIQANLVNHIVVHRITRRKYKQALKWLIKEEEFVELAELDESHYFRHHVRIAYYRGEINFKLGNYCIAKEHFEYVCDQGREIGWQRFVNYGQNWLADILIIQGDLDKAQMLLDSGISIAQANREKRRIGHYQAAYARFEVAKNNLGKAKEWAIKALSRFQQENVIEDAKEMENLIELINFRLNG